MKYIKGFGKNYFSLCAITMFSCAKKLQDSEVIIKNNAFKTSTFEEEEKNSTEDCLLFIQTEIEKEPYKSKLNKIFTPLLNQNNLTKQYLFINQLYKERI